MGRWVGNQVGGWTGGWMADKRKSMGKATSGRLRTTMTTWQQDPNWPMRSERFLCVPSAFVEHLLCGRQWDYKWERDTATRIEQLSNYIYNQRHQTQHLSQSDTRVPTV